MRGLASHTRARYLGLLALQRCGTQPAQCQCNPTAKLGYLQTRASCGIRAGLPWEPDRKQPSCRVVHEVESYVHKDNAHGRPYLLFSAPGESCCAVCAACKASSVSSSLSKACANCSCGSPSSKVVLARASNVE